MEVTFPRTARLWIGAIGLAVWTLAATNAQAASVAFAAFDATASTAGVNIWMDVQDGGDTWDFVFHNGSTNGAVLTDIYFESTHRKQAVLQLGRNNRKAINSSSGVDFVKRATPKHLVGKEEVSWKGNAFSFGSRRIGKSKTVNGVSSSESVTIQVRKAAGSTLNDVLALLESPGTRIATYIRGLGDNSRGKASFIAAGPSNDGDRPQPDVTMSPLPAAVWPGLILLGALGLRRKRTLT
jgi:hypothetical protein